MDDEPFNKKKYNLGLAHGIPSILCFLSKTYAKGINKSLSKKLLDGSVNWLLKHKCNIANVSIYPEVVYENSNNNFSRLAWCNGDLGVAICLWQAGNSLGKKSLLEESLIILDSSISRTHKMETLVMDNCLCHGATGIAHIYNNFYQITKLKKIKTAAINWYKVVLEMKTLTDDSGFYKTWSIDDNDIEVWTNNCGILNGVAGIGLSLISSISKIKPSWDSCLLLR
ncbi:MAG: hypothetical protein IPM92_09870 [Saprospiraceae bacterium]|nr:hypothetical protein [Saprospiraceae bacterium]